MENSLPNLPQRVAMDEACPKCGADDGIAGKCAAMFVAQNAEIASLRAELTANNELYSISQSDLAAVSLQYDAATAVIERLEAEIADRDRVIEGLNKQLSEQFELSTKYVGLWDKQCAAARQDAEEKVRLKEALTAAEKGLKPFANAVFNDNGDMTVSPCHDGYEDFISAYFALRKARAALASLPQGEVRVQAHGPFPGAPFSPKS